MLVKQYNLITLFGAIFLVFLASTDLSFAKSASILDNPAFAPSGSKLTSIPIGHANFCKERPTECQSNKMKEATASLNQNKWQELLNVNSKFNASIIPITDQELYGVQEFWTYSNGYGDCEEYVLEKRRALIGLGWKASSLLITVVRQANGQGHAVLMVRTDRGDLILDNQASLIKVWNDTPYRYLKRQSQQHSAQWVDIIDNRTTIIASR